jgi:hypothetical protein
MRPRAADYGKHRSVARRSARLGHEETVARTTPLRVNREALALRAS